MALSNVWSRSQQQNDKRSKPQKVYENALSKAQETYASARETGRTTYDQVQDSARSGWQKAQGLMALGIGVGSTLVERNKRQTEKELKKQQKHLRHQQKSLQKNATKSFAKTQDMVSTGLSTAQQLFEENAHKAQKNLSKAQKNLSEMQSSLQDSLQSGLSKTQDTLSRSSKKAVSSVVDSARERREEMARQHAKHQRQRARAKAFFRWGLVLGVIAAILYAPVPGSETRQRIASQVQRVRANIGI